MHDDCHAMAQNVNDLRGDKLRIAARAEMDLEHFTDPVEVTTSQKAGLLTPPRIQIVLPEYWAYLPCIAPAVGTTVIVRAVGADALGGISIAQGQVTLTDEYLGTSADLADRRHNR